MSRSAGPYERLSELTIGLSEGSLSEADGKELDALLAESEDSRERYDAILHLDTLLLDRFNRSDSSDDLLLVSADAHAKTSHRARFLPTVAKVAAAFAVGFAAAWIGSGRGLPSLKYQKTPAAMLIEQLSEEAVWNQTATPLATGLGLMPGASFTLLEGSVTLRSKTGAMATLRGLTHVHIIDESTLSIDRGTALVEASRATADFVVETPAAKVTDLGTMFGLQVNEDGSVGTAVFDGLVEVEPRHRSPEGEPTALLREGETLTIGPWWSDGAPAPARSTLKDGEVTRARSGAFEQVLSTLAYPEATFGHNLVVNGSGERLSYNPAAAPAPVADFPGWSRVGRVFGNSYEQWPFITLGDTSQIPDGGEYYFLGGDEAFTSLSQEVSLEFAAQDIDAGGVLCELSALLGGYFYHPLGNDGQHDTTRTILVDTCRIRLELIDEAGEVSRVYLLGPPDPAGLTEPGDLQLRDDVAAYLQVTRQVPPGVRKARVTLVFDRMDGGMSNGFADNVELRLFPSPTPEVEAGVSGPV